MTQTQHFDIIVVGSGAAGMTAALRAADNGLTVVVIEKSRLFGGASAMSGGALWIPNHGLPSSVPDNREEAYTYLRGRVGATVSDAFLNTFLERGPEMIRYLVEHTRVRFEPQDVYMDFYPLDAGAKPGGRTLDPLPYAGKLLGDEFHRLREQHPQTVLFGRYHMTIAEARTGFAMAKGWIGMTARLMLDYWLDLPQRLRSKRSRRLCLGGALVGRLRHSMLDRGIPLWCETPLRELIIENGRVRGVLAERDGQPLILRANKAVILATGGFEHNQAMREQYLPKPTRTEWSGSSPENTGDGIRAGIAVGADTRLMHKPWWAPAAKMKHFAVANLLFVEKAQPRIVFVDANGRRFENEASPYHDYADAAYPAGAVPAFAIFDSGYRSKYMFGPLLPTKFMPVIPKALFDDFLVRANSIEELARKLGVDPAGLRRTIDEFNGYCKTGVDTVFNRGGNIYEHYYGDPAYQPNPCLGPIDKPPYYGAKVFPGDLGTRGGLAIDCNARVLRADGSVIEGLYACGNCAAPVMGETYPGAGSTLGPAMTFGYVAAQHIGTAGAG